MVYAASIHTDLDYLLLTFDILIKVLPSPVYVLTIK